MLTTSHSLPKLVSLHISTIYTIMITLSLVNRGLFIFEKMVARIIFALKS